MSEQANIEVVTQWVSLLSRWGDDPADIPKPLELMDDECEWVLMATGERFRGKDAIRKMSEKSMAAVKHSGENQLKVTNVFGCKDQVCLEYLHRALITMPGETRARQIEMPICIVFLMRNGKIAEAREYYEVQQLQGAEGVKPLYSS